MLLKIASNQAGKDISVEVVISDFRAKKEILNYKIKFGMNMSTANRQLLNQDASMVSADNGFLNN